MFNKIPKQLQQNIMGAHGDKGQQWLNTLPQLIAKYAERWELTAQKPVANLTYHYVMTARKDNHAVVLKLGVPQSELLREMECLAHYNGNGAPKLLASDPENGAMLMDCVTPGTTLKSYFPHNEETSLAIVATVIAKLRQVNIPHDLVFPNIERWHASLYQAKPSITIPEELLTSAQQLSRHLTATQAKPVLLHGDLHHDNILLGEQNQWFAIDPKGIIGEPAYELGAFIRNPLMELHQQTNSQAIVRRRIDAFAQYLDLDSQRIAQWSFVQAVLSACWSMEEHQVAHAEYAMRCALMLKDILQL